MLQFSHRCSSISLSNQILAPLRRGEPPRLGHASEAAEPVHGLRDWERRFEFAHFFGR